MSLIYDFWVGFVYTMLRDMIKALCVYNLNLQPLIAKKNFLIMNSLALTFDPKTINEFVLESLSLKRKKMSTLL